MPWPCFMVDETGDGMTYLRVYDKTDHAAGRRCAADDSEYSYCEAKREFKRVPLPRTADGAWESIDDLMPPETDRRWRVTCDACGKVIPKAKRRYQLSSDPYYREVDGDREWLWRELPPGAMYYSRWHGEHFGAGPDGKGLLVILPPSTGYPSVWHIDGPSSSGGRWTRTGVPPNVTVQPSILTGEYHSFLVDGVLGDSLPDRPLPEDSQHA